MLRDNTLRIRFDEVADLYDRARPSYPEVAFDTLLRQASLPTGGSVLEVGCGTGQATLPLARRGVRILALELGKDLAEVAAERLRDYPDVTVEHTAFEEWQPTKEAFDLFLSAQAFHWIEPSTGLARASTVLKPGGTLALIWNLERSQESAFYHATNPIYQRYEDSMPQGPSLDDWVCIYREALERHHRFHRVTLQRYDWQQTYEKQQYLDLLTTFSSTLALDCDTRTRFLTDMATVIDSFGGTVPRCYSTALLLAKRSNPPHNRS
ncbi:MAG: class I SAM-dependent methyltransferase [Trueperaceae bacterium]|nr:MAG: class I SAM-dependent methyltransferase [Trueperaceae bacterium]